jgi:hypothetical protein
MKVGVELTPEACIAYQVYLKTMGANYVGALEFRRQLNDFKRC